MAERLRIGVFGFTHDHIWENLEALAASDGGVLVAAADPHLGLRQEMAEHYPDAQLFEDAGQLLESVELDAVYVYGDNRSGVAAAELAAARGLHIMVEKPMASTLAGADRMRRAAHAAGVQLMINWPIAWMPPLQQAFRMIEAGEIGEIFQVTYRSAHGGPRELGCSPYFSEWLYDPERNGAGALMDYCCYGAAMTCLLLGLPARVTALAARLRKVDLPAEDNAVLLMQHPRALSSTTASWTQIGHLTSYVPMFYGSEGTLVIQNEQLLHATRENDMGQPIDIPAQPAHMRNSAEFFIHHIRTGAPITGLCSPEVGLQAQEVLEAGLRSVEQGCAISLPLTTGRYLPL
jgi:predicted dehydrogenase